MDSHLSDLKEYECGLRMDELSVNCLLYADDQVILAPSACGLQEMVHKMNDSFKKRSTYDNVSKTKTMVFESKSMIEYDVNIGVYLKSEAIMPSCFLIETDGVPFSDTITIVRYA
ncbi:hypothetical protein EVAR_34788_1 [Eumeta japonica]|uniref:Reverse transcriptase domain-containing protein n=1 Tax=Eumeta variegata TaxID=151549 RepID=A0A4C1WDU1_EUMVA|nr:hypothetical protein EVAR_34788_1 [Eumeta japonica]